jgi:hypothetical protein
MGSESAAHQTELQYYQNIQKIYPFSNYLKHRINVQWDILNKNYPVTNPDFMPPSSFIKL